MSESLNYCCGWITLKLEYTVYTVWTSQNFITLISSSQYGRPSSSSNAKCSIVLLPDSTPYTSSKFAPISWAILTWVVKPGRSSSSRASSNSD